jgi:excisionase family DNA binding protein
MKTMIPTSEAAEILGVSTRRVVQFVEDGRLIPAMKVGKNYLFYQADVEKLARLERKEGRPKENSKKSSKH